MISFVLHSSTLGRPGTTHFIVGLTMMENETFAAILSCKSNFGLKRWVLWGDDSIVGRRIKVTMSRTGKRCDKPFPLCNSDNWNSRRRGRICSWAIGNEIHRRWVEIAFFRGRIYLPTKMSSECSDDPALLLAKQHGYQGCSNEGSGS